ncbi:Alkaline phosphatase synthesis transcriptional regulatory protein PhoP [Roseovarius sp. THAF9]|uniref:response regulator n=1 Tax=Roseovarius sp. THAF9 TaxID=2587847 RepID=UPI001268F19F|nr:response regulator [Roseovarius sp. THAF9]QFT92133.1 Alkaline phosphatase synthesis transcriptional regulatory protein PhoP [Roseovarius sp. THAF9]
MRILAVDDDESMLELIDHSLSISAHHYVATAISAEQALEKIESEEVGFDCFLVDIQMPRVDGIDLTSIIRRIAGCERKPVVMLTAMHEKPYLDMAFRAGATDYITKPFNFRELRSRIFEAGKMCASEVQSIPDSQNSSGFSWVNGELIYDGPVSLSDDGDVKSLLSFVEFENYVQETARAYMRDRTKPRNGGPAAIGLKIACPQSNQTYPRFEPIGPLLSEVVQAANTVFYNALNYLSYRGNGTFLCLLNNHVHESSGSLERELNVCLGSRLNDLEDYGIHVFAGNQVPLRTSLPSAALDILWMAGESVEQKFIAARHAAK